ncbi:MAG TPA: hypothetical protein VGC76_02010 [Pyrinomonadaceae bacterium]|jgi:hypothetical protein
MFFKFLQFIFLLTLVTLASVCVNAQVDASSPNGRPRQEEDLPKSIKENLAKGRIEQEIKEHEELLKRGDEALELCDELEKSFVANNKLSSEDYKKLDRLEKLVRKIRSDLGGDDDDANAEEKNPSTVENAFKILQENTVQLVDELKKSTRYSISVLAIESSNVLLKVVRFLRFKK